MTSTALAGDADAQLGENIEVTASLVDLDLESENISGQPVSSFDGRVQRQSVVELEARAWLRGWLAADFALVLPGGGGVSGGAETEAAAALTVEHGSGAFVSVGVRRASDMSVATALRVNSGADRLYDVVVGVAATYELAIELESDGTGGETRAVLGLTLPF